jgi:hypothetical protein
MRSFIEFPTIRSARIPPKPSTTIDILECTVATRSLFNHLPLWRIDVELPISAQELFTDYGWKRHFKWPW